MRVGDFLDVTAEEVLVLDSSTFVAEIGLTSRDGSALKHYLFSRGTQLVVPEVVAEECSRRLAEIASGKKKKIEGQLQWLARFCGTVRGWEGPNDEVIENRAKALAGADHLKTIELPETAAVRKRAEQRRKAQRPPSHKRDELSDCRIWEQCLELLAEHDVVFVSQDGDFCGHDGSDGLHPQLREETEKAGGGAGG